MSDLFARIGPKASSPDDFHSTTRRPVKYFPNKVWVREGYQVKKTRQQWNTNDYNAGDSGHDSDTSSKSHDDGHDRDDEVSWEPHVSSIHRPQSPPSLLLRMGLSPGIKVEEVSQTVPKDVPADNVPSAPVSFNSTKPTPTMQTARTTPPIQPFQPLSGGAEGSEKGLEKAGDKNTEIVPSSLSSVGSEKNQPNVIASLKTSSPHVTVLEKRGMGRSKQQEVARSPRVDDHHKNPQHATQELTTTNLPTPPSSTPLSDISSINALPVAIPTNVPSQTDGEPRAGCSSEVKSQLGRIVEQNTARRVADQGSSTQSQPVVIPPSVLTDEVCESVAKNMGQAQKEIDAILASPQIQSLIQAAAAAGQQVSDASTFKPDTQSSGSSPSRIPAQIPPEMLTPQGPSNEHTSGHSKNNHTDRPSPALSRERGSSAEYNDDHYYHSRPEPYSPRGRGRGRGFYRAGWRGRGRGRGFAPYDGGYAPYDRSDDYHRRRSFSPRRSTSPYPKYPYPKRGYDDKKYSRSRSRSRSKSPGKGKSRYRSRSRGRSRSPRRSRSRSPAARTKSYRSRHDHNSVSPRRRRASEYSPPRKHSKRHSRSRSRSSIASSRSRSAERRHKKKKHRLKGPSRSVSPRDDKYSSKKRKHRTPSPEERRTKRHSSLPRYRDRTPSRDRDRERDDRTGGPHSEASTRVSEKLEDKKLQEVQKRESTPPRAARSEDRTPQPMAEPVPAKAPSAEVQETTIRPLPCHNVPGLWSARLGNEGISTFQCVFEIDELTAKKWDISMPRLPTDPRRPAVMPKQKLGVQICSYLKPEIEALMQSLQPGISPQEVAHKITSLKQNWPSTRDLVITIHPKLPGKKTWLSFEIGPGLDIAPYIHQGNNIVEFVQLCDMSNHMFVLLSSENDL